MQVPPHTSPPSHASHPHHPHRRAIEMAEAKSLNKENETPPTQLCITLRHVADVITEVYGCGVGVGEFPLQQKLVVCTLLCLVRGRGRKECTLGKLYDSYAKVSYALFVEMVCYMFIYLRYVVAVGYEPRARVSL